MGLSKSKSKTKNEPWKAAQPYILRGMEQTQRVFDSQQDDLEGFAAGQRDAYGRLAPGAEAGILGAQGQVNSTLNGDYLDGNPYTDGILERMRGDVTNGVNSQFSKAGRYGSGNHGGILARELANAQNSLLYGNYAAERQNQVNAVGQASGLMGGAQSLLNNAANLPWVGVNAMNGNIRQASNGYGTQTGTQSQPWGQMLLGAAAGAANAFSDRRLKKDIVTIGKRPDGLTEYEWTYRHDPEAARYRGVMADEVKELRPEAYIANFNGTGFAGVNYAELGQ